MTSSKPVASGVEVKPLKWVKRYPSEFLSRAEAIVGCYRVWSHHEADGEWFWSLDSETASDGSEETEVKAKAAAEADYRNRILSALLPKATAPVLSEPEQQVIELKMTPIAEGLPVRDELRGEQTVLTYNDKVGTWDISFMEAGWDDYDAGFALGVSHWLDITEMWPGVIAQVASFYASPQPQPKAVTEERLPTLEEAAAAAAVLLRCNGHDLDVWTGGDFPDEDDWLKALAAMKEA